MYHVGLKKLWFLNSLYMQYINDQILATCINTHLTCCVTLSSLKLSSKTVDAHGALMPTFFFDKKLSYTALFPNGECIT